MASTSASTWAEMAASSKAPQEVPSTTTAPPTASTSKLPDVEPRIDSLILDAGPLLAQLPLRNLSKKYYIPPMVLSELKDKRAREHLEFLKISGLDFEVREAGPEAYAAVIAFAKLTGDYAVLSRPDLSVLALAYAVEVERHGTWRVRSEVGGKTGQQAHEAERLKNVKAQEGERTAQSGVADHAAAQENGQQHEQSKAATLVDDADQGDELDAQDDTLEAADEDEIAAAIAKMDMASQERRQEDQTEVDADGDEDGANDEGWTTVASSSRRRQQEERDYGGSDGEGEWITSDNITTQKHKDLGLVTDEALTAMKGGESVNGNVSVSTKKKSKKGRGRMTVATMTADYAVQNVLLQMGMALVSTEGYRIEKVRSWVLRCHACFKLCKDVERKFCPECGNPSLIRTSVTSQAPGSSSNTATTSTNGLQVHLKKNFQYKTRGNIYSLPLPKPGSASNGKDPRKAVPILREDQVEWQRGLAKEEVRKRKEQKALEKALEKGKDTISARYEDPDWLPGMLAESGRKGSGFDGGLPDIGFGRRNPNQARHGRRRK